MKTKDLGEKKIISQLILPKFKSNTDYGLGDDAAVIEISDFEILLTTDKVPENLVSLELGLMSFFEYGRYLSEVNISDIAAMGGKPSALLLNLTMPDNFNVEDLSLFLDGVKSSCDNWGVNVVGGDTKWGSAISFTATCMGIAEKGKAIRRSGAKLHDNLYVSGIFGLFSTALTYFLFAKNEGLNLTHAEEELLRKRLVYPNAKVTLGTELLESGFCTSCMDITDGFSQSLEELSSSSNLVFEVYEENIEYHPLTLKIAHFMHLNPIDIIFGVGLDLELLFTASKENEAISKCLKIGKAIKGNKNLLICKNGEKLEIIPRGWEHFSGKIPRDTIKDKLTLSKEKDTNGR